MSLMAMARTMTPFRRARPQVVVLSAVFLMASAGVSAMLFPENTGRIGLEKQPPPAPSRRVQILREAKKVDPTQAEPLLLRGERGGSGGAKPADVDFVEDVSAPSRGEGEGGDEDRDQEDDTHVAGAAGAGVSVSENIKSLKFFEHSGYDRSCEHGAEATSTPSPSSAVTLTTSSTTPMSQPQLTNEECSPVSSCNWDLAGARGSTSSTKTRARTVVRGTPAPDEVEGAGLGFLEEVRLDDAGSSEEASNFLAQGSRTEGSGSGGADEDLEQQEPEVPSRGYAAARRCRGIGLCGLAVLGLFSGSLVLDKWETEPFIAAGGSEVRNATDDHAAANESAEADRTTTSAMPTSIGEGNKLTEPQRIHLVNDFGLFDFDAQSGDSAKRFSSKDKKFVSCLSAVWPANFKLTGSAAETLWSSDGFAEQIINLNHEGWRCAADGRGDERNNGKNAKEATTTSNFSGRRRLTSPFSTTSSTSRGKMFGVPRLLDIDDHRTLTLINAGATSSSDRTMNTSTVRAAEADVERPTSSRPYNNFPVGLRLPSDWDASGKCCSHIRVRREKKLFSISEVNAALDAGRMSDEVYRDIIPPALPCDQAMTYVSPHMRKDLAELFRVGDEAIAPRHVISYCLYKAEVDDMADNYTRGAGAVDAEADDVASLGLRSSEGERATGVVRDTDIAQRTEMLLEETQEELKQVLRDNAGADAERTLFSP